VSAEHVGIDLAAIYTAGWIAVGTNHYPEHAGGEFEWAANAMRAVGGVDRYAHARGATLAEAMAALRLQAEQHQAVDA
jgi:hypothetical protein